MAMELCTVYEREMRLSSIRPGTGMFTEYFSPTRKIIIRVFQKGSKDNKPNLVIYRAQEPVTAKTNVLFQVGKRKQFGMVENVREEELSVEFLDTCLAKIEAEEYMQEHTPAQFYN